MVLTSALHVVSIQERFRDPQNGDLNSIVKYAYRKYILNSFAFGFF